MPQGFSLPSSDVETIVGVQFSIFSPEEIEKRSVVEVVSKDTYVGNEPKIGGLFDPRMGILDNGKICRSCGQTNHKCPGHFGHYRLARPVYFFQFFQYIKNILRCVCISCGKLLIDKELHKDLLKKSGEARWKEVYNLCSNIDRCGQEAADGCGAPQPAKFMKEGIARIVALFSQEAVTTQNALAITTGQTAVQTTQTSAGQKLSAMELEVEFVHRLFRRISDEDVDFMGFSRYWCRPDWMICTVLPIPPPQVRPSVVQDNNQRSEDDLTHKLHDIIKHDQYLAQKIAANAKKEIIDELISVVQYHVATLVDNQIPGVSLAAQRSGRPLKSIQQRIGAKEGRIRYNIQGKRVEFSARSVITGDPNLSIQELGVPLEIATNLSIPEKVTQWNRDKLYKLVQNGPTKWPGAKTIVRADGRMISLKHVHTNEIVLYNGDTVNRHLMDNDIVLFNRQPTLHKMSMMGHRAKILPYKTFRLNVQVVKPYNADFDGDEMNAHISQSEKAQVELQEIAAVPHQIITPRHAKPVIGVVQDALVGSYRITRPGINFNRREFMNLMMYNRRFDGTLPTPKADNGRWTGQQVMSQLLPPINMSMGNKSFEDKDSKESPNFVKIHQGEIIQGTLDDDIFGKAGKGIVHVAYNDYGSKQTVEMLDAIQSTVESFLVLNGFSVGISDLVADSTTKSEVEKVIQNQKKAVEQIILQVHLGLFDNNTGKTNQQEFEDQMFAILNEATKSAGKLAQNSLSVENRLISMIKAGSKGSTTNIAQMVACLGQQAIEGKRITYGFTDRTLPHYKKYDDSAEARGFVESSFIRGLSPQEFFFHAMGGREGLIDTAVKTAETGYIQRQLIKGLEDLVTQHDGTVRDSNSNIIQFHYGEDGTAATRIENQSLPLAKMSHSDIRRQFMLEGADWANITPDGSTPPIDTVALTGLVAQVIEDQRMLVEGIGRGNGLDAGSVQAPVNLVRTITTIKTQFGIRADDKTDLQPNYVLAGIQNIVRKTMPFNRIWAALLRFYLSPHNIIIKERFTMRAFDSLAELLVLKNMRSWAQPGEQVGIVAAQSIGEPSTQMTLNTFHLAGVASKSNVTRGVPRLRELLKVTKNPKATSLTITMKPEYRNSKERAREVQQDLELTILRNITEKVAIYWEPNEESTVLDEDKDLLHFARLVDGVLSGKAAESDGFGGVAETKEQEKSYESKWVLRLELNKEVMFNKNISIQEVVFAIQNSFQGVEVIYSDYNADKLVLRIKIDTKENKKSLGYSKTASNLDDYINLKKFKNRLLTQLVIRGIPGIKAVTFRKDNQKVELRDIGEESNDRKYQDIEQYILDTDGSNFIRVMNHPMVDGSKLYSTNVHDIYEVLGVEATREALMTEINVLFNEVGVNYRHLGLLTDVMTRNGRLMSIDRYGINKSNIGPLAKMSFEETESIVQRASIFGEIDPVMGVSANIMMGQTIRGGTAFSQILLDEQALTRLREGLPPVQTNGDGNGEEQDGDISDLLDQANIVIDPCATNQFQVHLQVPQAQAVLDEPDVDIEVM